MRELNTTHADALREMIDAFRELSDEAMRLSMMDWDEITELHGRFFNAKMAAQEAYEAVVALVRKGCDGNA